MGIDAGTSGRRSGAESEWRIDFLSVGLMWRLCMACWYWELYQSSFCYFVVQVRLFLFFCDHLCFFSLCFI